MHDKPPADHSLKRRMGSSDGRLIKLAGSLGTRRLRKFSFRLEEPVLLGPVAAGESQSFSGGVTSSLFTRSCEVSSARGRIFQHEAC